MDKKQLIQQCRDRYKKAVEADGDNRKRMIEDMKFCFVPGEQWDQFSKRERAQDRPMYEFNRARVTAKRIINEMRANRPAGKVRGYEDGDKELATIYEGICRNIWNVSDGDTITDQAAEYQVAGGYAAWRVTTKYSDDSAFDQDILIEKIKNPLCLWCDPSAIDLTGKDAQWWVFTDKISNAEYERRWPKADKVEFESEQDDDEDWMDGEFTRICEYWYKEPVKKTIHLLSDGSTIDDDELTEAAARGLQVMRSREVDTHKIKMAILSGDAVLEEPTDWAGSDFPWVRVYGEHAVIDGKTHWYGVIRHVKDAQRAFNLAQTAIIETIAAAPQAKIWATAAQANGLMKDWAEAHKKNLPFMLYNQDPAAPGPPVRIGGADVPAALVQQSMMNAEEIKANSGIFDNSLGQNGNESSGVAIARRAAQGQMVTFNFPDNMAKGVQRTWEILIKLIPKVFDTPRIMRILGADDSEKYVRVNQPDEQGNVINDLSRGKFDVVVTVGPSFATQRQEAVEAYTNIAQTNPAITQVAGDLMFKAMDLPYADEIAERMKAILPPQIQQTLNQDAQVPPEVQQMMMQAEQAMQQVQQQGMLIQQAQQELEKEKANNEKIKSELQVQSAQLDVQKANLEAQFAKIQQQLAEKINQAAQGETTAEGATQAANELIAQASAVINDQIAAFQAEAQDFMQAAAQLIAASQERAPVVLEAERPKVVSIKRMPGGGFVGTVTEEGSGEVKQVAVQRVNGELVGTIN